MKFSVYEISKGQTEDDQWKRETVINEEERIVVWKVVSNWMNGGIKVLSNAKFALPQSEILESPSVRHSV